MGPDTRAAGRKMGKKLGPATRRLRARCSGHRKMVGAVSGRNRWPCALGLGGVGGGAVRGQILLRVSFWRRRALRRPWRRPVLEGVLARSSGGKGSARRCFGPKIPRPKNRKVWGPDARAKRARAGPKTRAASNCGVFGFWGAFLRVLAGIFSC